MHKNMPALAKAWEIPIFSKSSTYLAGKLVLFVGIFLLVVSILDEKINQF